jgi:adenylate cyclase
MTTARQALVTSKEIMAAAGISRATLNNYIQMGLLPRPLTASKSSSLGTTPRIGYFPASALGVLERVKKLKKEGNSMTRIVSMIGPQKAAEEVSPATAPVATDALPPVATPANAPWQGMRLTIDQIDGPAYMVNGRFELEWANDAAFAELFNHGPDISNEITERKFFNMALAAPVIAGADGFEEFLRFHVAIAKRRLARSGLMDMDGFDGDFRHTELLARVYDETQAQSGGMLVHTQINLAPRGETERWYAVHASFFREGIFFAYSPMDDAGEELMSLLARRDIVIRDLLKKRRPYLTDLAVLVADLQNSVRICAELPPEEYFLLVNEIWGAMEPILRRHFGTHGKHVGDGMVSYFFPQPDSNYLLNALSCARAMRAEIAEISKRWRGDKNWLNELILNIGVHEGQEWFGTFQTPTHVEFTVLGDTINMAARLSDLARDGEIWSTKSLIGKLAASERERVQYGIRRASDEGPVVVPKSFSRVSNLIEAADITQTKFADIATLAVTEVFDIAEPAES